MNAIGKACSRFLSCLCGLPPARKLLMTPRQRLGRKAESYAADHLRRCGYDILKRNYRSRSGEIDIIAFHNGAIAFVEVRSRTHGSCFEPGESVDGRKQRKIISAARDYRIRHLRGHEVFLRFDVAAVTFDGKGRICGMEYYEDAFRPERL